MARTSFGATVTLLEQRFFPGALLASDLATTQVTGIIEEVAATLGGALRAVGTEPDSITVGRAPDSYAWCQTTVLYGVAAEYSLRNLGGGNPAQTEGWRDEFRDRLRQLRDNAPAILSDLASTRQSANVSHALV